jgi:hypothetical protein
VDPRLLCTLFFEPSATEYPGLESGAPPPYWTELRNIGKGLFRIPNLGSEIECGTFESVRTALTSTFTLTILHSLPWRSARRVPILTRNHIMLARLFLSALLAITASAIVLPDAWKDQSQQVTTNICPELSVKCVLDGDWRNPIGYLGKRGM